MLLTLALKKVFGTKNDRDLKKIMPVIAQINQLESQMKKLSDKELQAKTPELKLKLERGATLNDILPEAFAVCREAGARVLNMRHFDVQLIGGLGLHEGNISEMKTGEGKTLVATLPCYLNGLSGKGVHVVTVNDYLAKRDSDWMGRIHRFLGLSVGCIVNSLNDTQRKAMYGCDITYGTNNEFGFDYLRDNMKPSLDMYVQRDHNFAIVDEVDSILIDEARTPLIISGPSDDSTDTYHITDKAVRQLKRDDDYTVEEKHRSVTLTEDGVHKLEKLLRVENLYAAENIELIHHATASLKAHAIFKKDVDYVVRDGQIVIVDEFTGRLMPGRRWSDGLHQAVEAKEGVQIEAENQTLATITLQNYFRLYKKLAGMTGTADTEAAEFKKIYNLNVLVIPPNRPMIREDFDDLVFRNEAGKYRAVIEDIKEKYEKGRPVLVGTVSVAKSERVSKLLHRENIPHNVLNAKNHEREAEIIAQAGHSKTVTIATNMAGRGTDILLAQASKESGGLHVIGTERHESRRIDNQLRGRAGRQGDHGSSRFYLSLEDDLMRIFASEKVVAIMDRIGMEEDVPIESGLVTKQIAGAQKRVELHHFDQREHLLKYDNVLSKQREVIYSMRRLVLEGKETRTLVEDLTRDFIQDICLDFAPPKTPPDQWNWTGIDNALKTHFGFPLGDAGEGTVKSYGDIGKVAEALTKAALKNYSDKERLFGEKTMRDMEKYFLLQSLDNHWKEHLLALDHLKEGIHLRGYAQKDPLVEYRKEGFELFKMLLKAINQSALSKIYTVRLLSPEEQAEQQRALEERALEQTNQATFSGPSLDSVEGAGVEEPSAQQGGAANPSAARELSPEEHRQQEVVNRGASAAMNFLKAYQEKKAKEVATATQSSSSGDTSAQPKSSNEPRVGRNDPCHCGSGKKFKNCHGKE